MKKLLLTLLLMPVTAFATPLPAGCYVADSYRLDPCWGEFESGYNWSHGGNRAFEENYYGAAVETIIFNGFNEKADKEKCQADYNVLSGQFAASDTAKTNQYNDLANKFNQLLAERNTIAGQLQTANAIIFAGNAKIIKLNKTIKKLKKK